MILSNAPHRPPGLFPQALDLAKLVSNVLSPTLVIAMQATRHGAAAFIWHVRDTHTVAAG